MSGGSTDTSGNATAPDGETATDDGSSPSSTGFDDAIVDILSWLLDTETRARIYVFLRQHPWSTSDEVADGTGLYPSTVRESLADLAAEGVVNRRKRANEGAGNNPYEYTAIAPSDLVGDAVGQVQDQLNALCRMDGTAGTGAAGDADAGPVTIQVETVDSDRGSGGSDASGEPKP